MRPFELLLVEDNPAEVRLAKEAISQWTEPCNLSVATDGRAAIDFLNRTNGHTSAPRPDLILLDINLPIISGFDVLKYLRSDAELRFIPVIAMSNSRSPHDIRTAYELQANCYIEKPLGIDEIVDVFKHIEHFWVKSVARAKLMNTHKA